MTTSIHYDRIAGVYAVERDGEFVGVGSTYHDAEVISASMDEAHYSNMIGGDPLLIEAQRFGERGSICAACEDQEQPCAVCEDDTKDQQPTGWCYVCGAAAWDWVAHGPLCPDHMGVWQEWQRDNTPLLAQCAAVIDRLLGGPVIGGGILDELRRVRAELRKAGW